ncbi:MAG: molybdate ABC transporter permease subunit [Actinobacteria bacterium]|nr:molybdate ABC transporter permease subunit [Actinomycetota bacterium]
MRHGFTTMQALALSLALAFLVLPVVAVFLQVSPAAMLSQLGGDAATQAIVVSLRTNVIADIVIVVVGTPAAWLLARHRSFPGRRVLVTLLELPLVLPPAVAGIALLVTFGRNGLLGGQLDALGVTIPFTEVAVVMAIIFVAGPFYLRQAITTFESIDPRLVQAAATLGAGPWRTFRKVVLPLAMGGLAGGWALAFARGLGEFGATLIFAGSLPGVTQTLPLAIYSEMNRDLDTALAIGGLLIVVAALVLLAVKMIPSWNPTPSSPPPSARRSATSPSTSR